MAKRRTAAIILAGGESSRMGTDKAFLTVRGKTLLDRLLLTAAPLISQIIVVLSQTQQTPSLPPDLEKTVTIARDSRSRQGPLQGISDALDSVEEGTTEVFVLSCDLPFVETGWLDQLKTSLTAGGVDAVVSMDDDVINPLLAIYRFDVILYAKEALAEGRKSCLALLDGRNIMELRPPAHKSAMAKGVNTPEEFSLAVKQLEDEKR